LCAQIVVQVTPGAPPLLLSRGDQALARVLQVGGGPHDVHSDLCLAGKILKQAKVGIGEPFSWCPEREYQASDLLPLVHQWQRFRFSSK